MTSERLFCTLGIAGGERSRVVEQARLVDRQIAKEIFGRGFEYALVLKELFSLE